MKVIVCGAGQVGFQIARYLASEENDVVVIDQSPERVAMISDSMDARGLLGHASHPDVLRDAGAKDADMLIAATYSDEVNMVACQVAHSLFAVPKLIARIRSQAYREDHWPALYRRDHLPINRAISPEQEVARVVLERLAAPSAFDSAPFLGGKVRLMGTRATEASAIINTPIRQIGELFPSLRATIVGYVRAGKLHSATADDQLFIGDEVYTVVDESHMTRALGLFGRAIEPAERIVLVGGGNVGVYVAQELERLGVRVRLIERDRKQAERAAELLERTIVVHGDGLDSDILGEAKAGDAHAIVALTDDDKVNVLACALAKEMGCGSAIALINSQNFARLGGPLGIDAFVNPRSATVSTILREVRGGRIRALYSLRDGEGEVLETTVLDTASIADRRIRDLQLPSGAVIGVVASQGVLHAPHPDLMINPNDEIVMFTLRRDLKKVEQLFRVAMNYFAG